MTHFAASLELTSIASLVTGIAVSRSCHHTWTQHIVCRSREGVHRTAVVRGVEVWNAGTLDSVDPLRDILAGINRQVVLVTGGKRFVGGLDLMDLVRSRCFAVVLLEGSPEWIAPIWGRHVRVLCARSIRHSAKLAHEICLPGGLVLFAPACQPNASDSPPEDRFQRFEDGWRMLA